VASGKLEMSWKAQALAGLHRYHPGPEHVLLSFFQGVSGLTLQRSLYYCSINIAESPDRKIGQRIQGAMFPFASGLVHSLGSSELAIQQARFPNQIPEDVNEDWLLCYLHFFDADDRHVCECECQQPD
jgi:hypothetical protein